MSWGRGCLGVHGGDGGLELVGAERSAGEGLEDQGGSLLDGGGVPESPVLLVDPDQALVRSGPGLAPGLGEQHQREQPSDLAVVG